MKCFVYPDGDAERGATFDAAPADAAKRYCSRLSPQSHEQVLVVEPRDNEARGLLGWIQDEEGSFRTFTVRSAVSVTWTVEVRS